MKYIFLIYFIGFKLFLYAGEPMKVLLTVGEINPYSELAPGGVLATMNAAVLGQLMTIDRSFDIAPALLENTDYNFKTHEYKLTLKKNLRFHNGRCATSKDLEFSLVRGFFTSHRSFYKFYLGNIQGIEDAENRPDAHFESGVISGVRIVDDYSVAVKLSAPNPEFIYALVNPYFSLVPIEEFKEDYITWKKAPVGVGPYKVVEEYKNNVVKLKKYDQSLKDAPDEVEFYSKEVPGVNFDVRLVDTLDPKKNGFETFVSEIPQFVYTLFFTNINPLGKSETFKKFLQSALDRKKIKPLIPATRVTFEILPHQFWGRAKVEDPYDPELARNLFAQLPKELREKEWAVPVYGGNKIPPDRLALANSIQQQLSEYGFKIKLVPSAEKFISKETATKAPFEISSRITDVLDPLIMFASMRFKNIAYPFEKPPFDPDFEKLYEAAEKSYPKENRAKSVQALSAYVNEKAFLIPLLEKHASIYFNPKKISSLGKQDQPLVFFVDRLQVLN